MLNFSNKEFRNLEEQVRKNQTDIQGIKSGVVVYKKVDYADLDNYINDSYLGKYFVATHNDEQHLYVVTKTGAYDNLDIIDLGVWPAKGEKGDTGATGQKGEKGDTIIGPRGYNGDQGAPGRGVDSLTSIDALSYEAQISQPDENGIREVYTSANVEFGAGTPKIIDFNYKYEVPTDFYSKSQVDSKDADTLAAAKAYTDAVENNITPHIGDNGHWYIGNYDTGVTAEGQDGAPGNGIVDIEKTSTVGIVDTYTITFTNGTTTNFQVKNGVAGDNGRGISTISKTGTSGLIDTYTITYTDDTTSRFTVTNGTLGYSIFVYLGNININTATVSLSNIEVIAQGNAPKAGDILVGYNGGLALILYIDNTTVYLQYETSIKGAKGSPETKNLLLNPNFQLNQRKAFWRWTGSRYEIESAATDGKYTFDRWLVKSFAPEGQTNTAYFTGKQLSNQTTGTGYSASISQIVDNGIYKIGMGKNATVAIRTTYGSGNFRIKAYSISDDLSQTYTIGTSDDFTSGGSIVKYYTFTTPGLGTHLKIEIETDGTLNTQWIVCYAGDFDNSYAPPMESEYELLEKCKGYFQYVTTGDSYKEYAPGTFVTSTQAYFFIPCSPMRTTPSMLYYDRPSSFNIRWGTHLVDGAPVAYMATVSTMTLRSYFGNCITLQCGTAAQMGDGALYGPAALRSGWSGSAIGLDAEIYA